MKVSKTKFTEGWVTLERCAPTYKELYNAPLLGRVYKGAIVREHVDQYGFKWHEVEHYVKFEDPAAATFFAVMYPESFYT